MAGLICVSLSCLCFFLSFSQIWGKEEFPHVEGRSFEEMVGPFSGFEPLDRMH